MVSDWDTKANLDIYLISTLPIVTYYEAVLVPYMSILEVVELETKWKKKVLDGNQI